MFSLREGLNLEMSKLSLRVDSTPIRAHGVIVKYIYILSIIGKFIWTVHKITVHIKFFIYIETLQRRKWFSTCRGSLSH